MIISERFQSAGGPQYSQIELQPSGDYAQIDAPEDEGYDYEGSDEHHLL